jgi:hypothetical protein
MAGELLEFPGGVMGIILNLEADNVGVVIMGEYAEIEEGDVVRSTGRIASVPVGDGLIGRVVNALPAHRQRSWSVKTMCAGAGDLGWGQSPSIPATPLASFSCNATFTWRTTLWFIHPPSICPTSRPASVSSPAAMPCAVAPIT